MCSYSMNYNTNENQIGDAMVSKLTWSVIDRDRVKPMTMILVFAASPLNINE